jgi:hypothetical protein
MHLNKFRLFIFLGLILLSIDQLFSSEARILVQHQSAPFYFINKEHKPDGLIPEMLTKLLGETYNLQFYTGQNVPASLKPEIIYLSNERNLPGGYQWFPLPIQLDYYLFYRSNENLGPISEIFNKKIIVVKDDAPFDALYQYKTTHILVVKSYAEAFKFIGSGDK